MCFSFEMGLLIITSFLENNAQILKDELQLVADKCLNEFSKDILDL